MRQRKLEACSHDLCSSRSRLCIFSTVNIREHDLQLSVRTDARCTRFEGVRQTVWGSTQMKARCAVTEIGERRIKCSLIGEMRLGR